MIDNVLDWCFKYRLTSLGRAIWQILVIMHIIFKHFYSEISSTRLRWVHDSYFSFTSNHNFFRKMMHICVQMSLHFASWVKKAVWNRRFIFFSVIRVFCQSMTFTRIKISFSVIWLKYLKKKKNDSFLLFCLLSNIFLLNHFPPQVEGCYILKLICKRKKRFTLQSIL